MIDYSKYSISLKERGLVLSSSAVITGVISFLFYHSIYGMVLLPTVYVLLEKRWKTQGLNKRKQELKEHFMNGLQVLEVSLQAGFSMENAWKEVEKETALLYGDMGCFYREVSIINRTVSFNMPIETLFFAFAERTKVEELMNFAQILDYGKKTGSNWKRIISDTVLRMIERYETEKEIEVMLASKCMEQRVMNIIPLVVLLFLKLSSWEYMSVLYGNVCGVMIMTVFLVLYVVAIWLSEKIMNIQV